jgi:hypothetical protein
MDQELFMTTRIILLTLGVCALTNTPTPAQPRRGDHEAAQYGWIFNLEAGKAQARMSGKPLMVVVRCVP